MDTAAQVQVRPITEFDGVHDVWPRGRRLDRVREAAASYKERFAAQGQVLGARTWDIAAAPYMTNFAFHGAAKAPNPYVSIVNRMMIVQFEDFDGARRTLVWEPTVPAGAAEAPFYAQMQERADKNRAVELLGRMVNKEYNTLAAVLASAGVSAESVDYISFDHLHVQDPRLIVPEFPNARLLVQRRELATFESQHPMQWAWYVDGGLDGVPAERIEPLDGDVELGLGVSLIWTPGHTDGNHSLCINTPEGIWVSSENGVSIDNWQPNQSRIPGVRRYAEYFNREICPNANTLEDSLDQYDSMVKEKTLADPCRRDPRWLQILPSSELVSWRRQWPIVPTFAHGGLSYGELSAG